MRNRILLVIGVSLVTFTLVSGVFLFVRTNPSSLAPNQIPSQSNFYLGDTRIFIISANASYGNNPNPTVTNPPYGNNAGAIIAQEGEPCIIIEVTLRNDYSTENPPSNNYTPLYNFTSAFVSLAAHLYNGNNQINATDITNASWVKSARVNNANTDIGYGENTTLSIYMATNSRNVTNFQLTAYVSALSPP